MDPNAFDIVHDAPWADIVELEARLDAFNARTTGIADARLLSILLKRGDGALYAGLHGHSWGETCQIKILWVAQPDRGRGLGSAMLKAAEAEALRRGCRQIMLATHSFQAPDFYRKHGFHEIAAVADNPVGHSDILMLKRIRRP